MVVVVVVLVVALLLVISLKGHTNPMAPAAPEIDALLGGVPFRGTRAPAHQLRHRST